MQIWVARAREWIGAFSRRPGPSRGMRPPLPGLAGIAIGVLWLQAADGREPELRVGIIGLDTSHVVQFTQLLNLADRGDHVPGARVVAAFPQGSRDIESSVSRVPGYTEQVRGFGVEIVPSIADLLERVDAVMLESNDGRVHLEQAAPVLAAGKRLFIDKPMAASLADAIAIFAIAREHRTEVFSSSSLRFGAGTQAVRKGSAGAVLGCDTYSPLSIEPTHPDLFWYGIHGCEALVTVMGTGCRSVSRTSTAEADLVVGVWEGGRIGTYRGLRDGKKVYGGTAFGTQSVAPVGDNVGYRPLVVEIVQFFRTGVPPVPERETIELLALMEAADESRRRDGGRVGRPGRRIRRGRSFRGATAGPPSLASDGGPPEGRIPVSRPDAVLPCRPAGDPFMEVQHVNGGSVESLGGPPPAGDGRPGLDRRTFFRGVIVAGGAAALGPAVPRIAAAAEPDRPIRVAVVGLGRGLAHTQAFLEIPGVQIAYLAEVDPQRLAIGMQSVAARGAAVPQGVKDFRTALEDPMLDAVSIATPNFWHTPAALLALEAGKHVYVEKPGSQNPREAELIVSAARRHGRLVQMGNQRRTAMRDAIAALHGGAIGPVRYGRAFYGNARKASAVAGRPWPEGLDIDLWQGPVPDDRDHDVRSIGHYDWHWLWHWGNGELGNNGIHFLDILRWGLKAVHPLRVTYTGSRYWHDDRQETPDTATATYDFGHAGCEWVHSSCHPRRAEKSPGEVIFYGDGGTMAIGLDAWTLYDPSGKGMGSGTSGVRGSLDVAHIGNFIAAIRGEAELNSPIDEGQKSTMLCHLGNIAYRTDTVVRCDPQTGAVVDNPAAARLWGRPAYRVGWGMPG